MDVLVHAVVRAGAVNRKPDWCVDRSFDVDNRTFGEKDAGKTLKRVREHPHMQYVILDRRKPDVAPPGLISAMCFLTYHGTGYRGSNELTYAEPVYLDTPNPPQARLWRSGSFIPPLFSPSGSTLVVEERLARRLSPMMNICVRELSFEKLIDLNVGKGDWSHDAWYKSILNESTGHPFHALPDVPELHSGVARYFEIVVPRYERVVHEFRSHLVTWTYARKLAGNKEVKSISLCTAMIEKYPIVFKGTFFIREDVFETLRQDIDRAFYEVVPAMQGRLVRD